PRSRFRRAVGVGTDGVYAPCPPACDSVIHGLVQRLVSGQARFSAAGRHRTAVGGVAGMTSVPFAWLVLIGVGAPGFLFAVLGATALVNRQLSERWVGALAAAAMATSCLALLAALLVHGFAQRAPSRLAYGEWSTTHEGGITIEFLVDRL